MTRIVVDHPGDWVGVPEEFPNSRWDTAYEWASELVEALRTTWGAPADGGDIVFRDILVSVANSLDNQEASRLFFSSDDWGGPLFLAAMAVFPIDSVPGRSMADIAGIGDVDAMESPVAGEFTTRDGVAGVSCIRYFARDEPDHVVARADFVVQLGDRYVDFYHENFDLADFQKAGPRLRELAATVSASA